jgi:hypothetical protein
MIVAMFLAHLVGDYILQWNKLAAWKSRELKGVTIHCLIVFAVTWLFILPFDPSWWPWAVFIGVAHFLIDAGQFLLKIRMAPLGRFLLDQIAHFTVIIFALVAGGYMNLSYVTVNVIESMQRDTILIYLLGYAFVTMPAWVLIKFTAYGLVKGAAPEFGDSSKYLGIFERLLITTFVALGQYYLVPLVTLPRFVMEWPYVVKSDQTAVYLAELLVSVTLAVSIGLLFRLV